MKLIILGCALLLIATVITINNHKHSEDCKWIAPLKTNYVMCNDGKVRVK